MAAGRGGPAPGAALTVHTSTVDETRRIGKVLGLVLRRTVAADQAPATLALVGPLGAGKTSLVQGLARGLGVSGRVRSPTFTLIHEHPGPVPLFHVDLYRLAPAEVEGLGFDEILDAEGVTAVEWAERAPIVAGEHLRIELRFGRGDSERCLRFAPHGARYERILDAVRACASWR